jgi:hypothetical protein
VAIRAAEACLRASVSLAGVRHRTVDGRSPNEGVALFLRSYDYCTYLRYTYVYMYVCTSVHEKGKPGAVTRALLREAPPDTVPITFCEYCKCRTQLFKSPSRITNKTNHPHVTRQVVASVIQSVKPWCGPRCVHTVRERRARVGAEGERRGRAWKCIDRRRRCNTPCSLRDARGQPRRDGGRQPGQRRQGRGQPGEGARRPREGARARHGRRVVGDGVGQRRHR